MQWIMFLMKFLRFFHGTNHHLEDKMADSHTSGSFLLNSQCAIDNIYIYIFFFRSDLFMCRYLRRMSSLSCLLIHFCPVFLLNAEKKR